MPVSVLIYYLHWQVPAVNDIWYMYFTNVCQRTAVHDCLALASVWLWCISMTHVACNAGYPHHHELADGIHQGD
jgi:hypothetical protein